MSSIISDPSAPISAATTIGIERTWRPVRLWNLGLPIVNNLNQIQTIKASTQSTLVSPVAVAPGVAQPVQNVRVTRRQISPTQLRVAVSFTPNPADKSFQGVNVSLSNVGGSPLRVASGTKSPVVFTVTKSPTALSGSISVQSVGSFGTTSPAGSPGRALTLQ